MNEITSLGVAVIGLGRFGQKRLASITADAHARLRIVADAVPEIAERTGIELGCDHTQNWQEAITRSDVDIVVVSTSTRFLPQIAQAALENGKHVLCEKPFGRSSREVLPAVEAAERDQLCLKVGYNHRYHPALEKAHKLFVAGAIGKAHFIRCVYGHGGRGGYEQEWRSQAQFSGGGQLLDQGVHALDLFRWFAGEFSTVKACTQTSFWPIAPLEDNVFALLESDSGCMASLHASWTNWKNTFVFEVFGEKGYLTVSGLGGHYGTERLCLGKAADARNHARGRVVRIPWTRSIATPGVAGFRRLRPRSAHPTKRRQRCVANPACGRGDLRSFQNPRHSNSKHARRGNYRQRF